MLSYAILDAKNALQDADRRGRKLVPLGLPARPMIGGGNTVWLKACYMKLKTSMTHRMSLTTVPPEYLPVVKNSGWAFVLYDGPKPGNSYKPG